MNHRGLGEVEITSILRLHLGQRSTLNPNVLFIITAHARRLDHANSSLALLQAAPVTGG